MILPEPARGLWKRVAEPLRAEMNTLDRFEPWRIGGGTILAARWDHRDSTDIDLKVAHNAGLVLLRSTYGGTFEKTMERLGATRIEYRGQQLSVHFSKGKIDITQANQAPATGHTEEMIDDHIEQISSTPQILHGKLHGRSLQSPVRDLYDFVVANEIDPEALEIAVNTLHTDHYSEMTDTWTDKRHQYREQAAAEIVPRKDRWRPIIDNPAEEAVQAVTDRRYKSVMIEIDKRQLHAICTCGDGAERRRTHAIASATELNDWLDRTGLAGYVDVAPDRNAREAVWKARTIATPVQPPDSPPL